MEDETRKEELRQERRFYIRDYSCQILKAMISAYGPQFFDLVPAGRALVVKEAIDLAEELLKEVDSRL